MNENTHYKARSLLVELDVLLRQQSNITSQIEDLRKKLVESLVEHPMPSTEAPPIISNTHSFRRSTSNRTLDILRKASPEYITVEAIVDIYKKDNINTGNYQVAEYLKKLEGRGQCIIEKDGDSIIKAKYKEEQNSE